MATVLDDLDLHYDPDLYLPIRGVVYRIAAPSVSEADRLRTVVWDKLDADAEHSEIVKVLGAAHQLMVDAEIPAPYRDHAGRTAIVHYGMSAEMGRAHWKFAHVTQRIDIAALIEEMKAMAAADDDAEASGGN